MLTRDDFTSKFGCDDGNSEDLVKHVEMYIEEICARINNLRCATEVQAYPRRLNTIHNPLRIGWKVSYSEHVIPYEDVDSKITSHADKIIDEFCESLQF